MVRVMSENTIEAEVDDAWADQLWERPAPEPQRLARYRLHDPDEPSHYVRNTAHLPQFTPDIGETGFFWMRLLRRASLGH